MRRWLQRSRRRRGRGERRQRCSYTESSSRRRGTGRSRVWIVRMGITKGLPHPTSRALRTHRINLFHRTYRVLIRRISECRGNPCTAHMQILAWGIQGWCLDSTLVEICLTLPNIQTRWCNLWWSQCPSVLAWAAWHILECTRPIPKCQTHIPHNPHLHIKPQHPSLVSHRMTFSQTQWEGLIWPTSLRSSLLKWIYQKSLIQTQDRIWVELWPRSLTHLCRTYSLAMEASTTCVWQVLERTFKYPNPQGWSRIQSKSKRRRESHWRRCINLCSRCLGRWILCQRLWMMQRGISWRWRSLSHLDLR